MLMVNGKIRVLHTSDLHLGSDDFEGRLSDQGDCCSLASVLQAARDNDASLLIVAGDMFDSCRVSDDLTNHVTRLLRDAQLPVVILPGNHDCLVPDSVYVRHSFSQMAPNVTVIMDQAGEAVRFPHLDLCLWGRPHVDYSDFNPLEGIPERGPEKWHVAIAHGLFVEEDAGYGRGWQITGRDLNCCLRDYVALGHLENFNRVGNKDIPAYYSGSPGRTGAAVLIEFSASGNPLVRQAILPQPGGSPF